MLKTGAQEDSAATEGRKRGREQRNPRAARRRELARLSSCVQEVHWRLVAGNYSCKRPPLPYYPRILGTWFSLPRDGIAKKSGAGYLRWYTEREAGERDAQPLKWDPPLFWGDARAQAQSHARRDAEEGRPKKKRTAKKYLRSERTVCVL